MPLRKPRFSGEVAFRVEKIDCRYVRRVFDIKRAAGKRFPQVPRPADWNTHRLGADKSLDLCLGRGVKDPLQDQEVDVLMAKRKREVPGEAVARPITLVENRPAVYLPPATADILL